jgi:hypothetical protein
VKIRVLQNPNSLRVGMGGLRGVTVQVFPYLNKILIYLYIYVLIYTDTYFTAI